LIEAVAGRCSALLGNVVEIGAQRVVREVLFPQARSKLCGTCRRMLTDSLQHIDQVSVGIDAVKTAGHNQTLRDTDVLRAELSPTEVP
jgi:hypothetical protein